MNEYSQEINIKHKNSLIIELIFAGSIIMLFCSLYIMQNLSIIIGFGNAAIALGNLYNINMSGNSLITGIIINMPAYTMSARIAYILFASALTSFAVSTINLFNKYMKRISSAIILLTGAIFLLLLTLFESEFYIMPAYIEIAAYVSTVVVISSSISLIFNKKEKNKLKLARNIAINPDTPYSNILLLSNELFAKLKGKLKILDMHFDSTALENLSLLLKKNEQNFSDILVLTSNARTSIKLKKSYRDYSTELANKGVTFMIRVMNDEDSIKQHERLLIDDSNAYKIPPLNIINRKSEHIVKVTQKDAIKRFDYIWNRATKLDNIIDTEKANS
ncbi:MAG: hypothetical protein QXD11_00870 [Candidatus Micrarchaeaceae archaeon]